MQTFTRPSNKFIKRWTIARAVSSGYVMTKYSDNTFHFFHEDREGYAMLTKQNQSIYNALKQALKNI